MEVEHRSSIQIEDGIYWVGSSDENLGLNCNPYLIVDNGEGILFDPGSVLDFETVYNNIIKMIPLEQIKYVVLHHQDPDFCSSVPLFEKAGAKFQIVTRWRAAILIKHYGVVSPFYIINENEFKLRLNSGREFVFIPTPYLHFPGAFVTYDLNSKILFSSDLFGAFSYNWKLFADDSYIEKMKMADYQGKVIIILNTATGCGFTPHYKDLELMYEQYHDLGLEIIDIPCNQFAGQTSGTDEEIHEFCTLKYNTQFPQMKKSDVNGEKELSLYTYLK